MSKFNEKNKGRTFGLHLNTAIWGDSGNYILWRGRLLHVAIILYLVAVVKGKKWGGALCSSIEVVGFFGD